MRQTKVANTIMDIENLIITIRGRRVLIDTDLAMLFGVPTKVLNQAIKRNLKRFPDDFMFQLSDHEKYEVVTNCDHLTKLKFSKTLPFAFTEHGAIQAANVLSSDVAVKPRFSIRRIYGAICVLTAHFRPFFPLFVANSQLFAPHSRQNCLENCIRHYHKS